METNKPLLSCSIGEFFEMATQYLSALNGVFNEAPVKKNYVYGLAGLSKLLGCSMSTAFRIKQSGVIAPAISQSGKLIVTDADLALDLLRERRKRRVY